MIRGTTIKILNLKIDYLIEFINTRQTGFYETVLVVEYQLESKI